MKRQAPLRRWPRPHWPSLSAATWQLSPSSAPSWASPLLPLVGAQQLPPPAWPPPPVAPSTAAAIHMRMQMHARESGGGGGREKKQNRKLLAITSCAKRIARCETTSWAPPLWRCPRCQGGLSNVSRCQTHPNLRNLKGNLTCMTHRHTQSNNIKIRKKNVVLAWLCSPS